MLNTLKRIVQTVSAAPDLSTALSVVVEEVKVAFHADASCIFLLDPDRGEYVLLAAVGLNSDQVGKFRLKLDEGLIGLVGEREEPINLADAPSHPNYFYYKALHESVYFGYLAVPIMHQGQLLGVLNVQQKEAASFPEEQEAFLLTLSAQLSAVIAHAKAKGALQAVGLKRRGKKTETVLSGIPGAPGVAIGRAVVVYPLANLDAVPDRQALNTEKEIDLFETALSSAREELHILQARAKSSLSLAENALFDAYLRLLDSRTLMNEVLQEIRQGQWAQGALKRVINKHVMHFSAMEDAYLRERAADFRDLGRRILSHLQAKKREQFEFHKDTILVSDEVTATLLMEVAPECLAGIVSGSGSYNSHVAILARALGVPTAMGVSGTPLSELAGKEVIVDGYMGHIYVSPAVNVKKEFKQLREEEHELDNSLESLRDSPATTTDGHTVSLHINTGLASEGGRSLSVGAEGVGLYRTEMPFMVRDRFPSESEQRVMYRQLLNTFAPRPVVMRTLDVGGDKMLPYFHITEDNPFLGWRGIRITLDHPEIFLQQIRAMLVASIGLNNLSIMLPMIASASEVDDALKMIHQAYHELIDEGEPVKLPKLGLMIEVPAAIYQAGELAKRVDFVSVGTNDLIQYLLAVDRNNPRVAGLYNGLHPAVLRALVQIVKSVHKVKKPVSLCGEMASDPVAVVLLLAMGFDSLSLNARSLPRMKWVIRQFSLEKAQQLLKNVLKMDDPIEIRTHMEAALDDHELGGLIRAGKF